ncbi:beta-galactosidase trimerization domain-containing protein, partial [Methylicorpusculum sp.]|uniref:beta-galactosidase trimerization domain-containing protein n=1 Tax=Methylicorpusculum sp. TaxID=2713644 RepID=UPI002ABB77F2
MFLIRWIILLAILTLTVVKGFDGIPALSDLRQEKLALALLVPDEANLDDPKLTAWLDAASEQGVKLDVLTASQFLRPYPFSLSRYAGVILPDSIHKMMSETLIGGVHDYVSSGGKLMLVFDAGTLLPPNQTYAQGQSLFSDLVGVNYAMYDTLGDKTIAMSEVFGEQVAFISLHVPPGKFSASQSGNPQLMSLSGYQNDSVEYSYFVTDTQFSGKTLLSGKGNKVIASVNTFGTGQVLFINLPLGYLK